MNVRIGHGFDAHRLELGRPFILGGVRIPCDRGPLGHSDADVVAHAIADALLGAAALGDLGQHFPDSEARWKDANSMDLLGAVRGMLDAANYRVGNVDVTVVVQAPRLAPFIGAMRASLAQTLGLQVNMISIKAKTSEGLGYTGDGSGIAAYAVALIGGA